MQFLPDVYVPCEECKGKRYNRETLEVKFRGKSIAEVLDMTVEEGLEFFENIPRLRNKLETLNSVGLSYLRVGQPATTLSGGEAQRIKLSKELSRRATSNTLYILDEPTTGLHFEDVRRLLEVLHELVNKGNTVLVIEHNLDVIKNCDWPDRYGSRRWHKGWICHRRRNTRTYCIARKKLYRTIFETYAQARKLSKRLAAHWRKLRFLTDTDLCLETSPARRRK